MGKNVMFPFQAGKPFGTDMAASQGFVYGGEIPQ
jgi:hypothetical protein